MSDEAKPADAGQTGKATSNFVSNSQIFQQAIAKLEDKQSELKELKSLMKDIEADVPMELEEITLSLKDLKKQAKDLKDEHIRTLLEDNVEYVEYREQIQDAKEEMAQAKLELFTAAANQSREKGDIDQTVQAGGAAHRLQTQREVVVYLNGKVVK